MIRRLALACACACAVAVLLGAAPTAPAAPTATATALQQLTWFVDASARVPVSSAEQQQHLSAAFLTANGGPSAVNAFLAQTGPLRLDTVLVDQPTQAKATVSGPRDDYVVDVQVDQTGLVDGLTLADNDQPPTSWSQLDAQLATLGGRVSFTASMIDPNGRCRPVHGVNAATQRPLGSAFKLYVLGALGQAVAEHHASWTEQLAIRDDWKSLPSGVLQNQPAGTPLTLGQYADYMISISDNTAADHLIHRLGRDAVARQLALFDNQRPQASIPFLTTKALFELKAAQYPARADAYLALPQWQRAAALDRIERLPLDGLAAWPQPEKIDQLEWFGSPNDVCRAFSGLQRENQSEIDHALSINDAGIGLDRAQFPTVWFKGGSELGVLTLNFLARTADGRTLVTSVMVSNPTIALNQAHVFARGLAIAKGALLLLAQRR